MVLHMLLRDKKTVTIRCFKKQLAEKYVSYVCIEIQLCVSNFTKSV